MRFEQMFLQKCVIRVCVHFAVKEDAPHHQIIH